MQLVAYWEPTGGQGDIDTGLCTPREARRCLEETLSTDAHPPCYSVLKTRSQPRKAEQHCAIDASAASRCRTLKSVGAMFL